MVNINEFIASMWFVHRLRMESEIDIKLNFMKTTCANILGFKKMFKYCQIESPSVPILS